MADKYLSTYIKAKAINHFEINLEDWIAKEMAEKFGVPGDLLAGTGTTASPACRLRRDARLIQVLEGVRAGTIDVASAALEIIENRRLDRRTFLSGSADAQVLAKPEPTLLGMPIMELREPPKPITARDYELLCTLPIDKLIMPIVKT